MSTFMKTILNPFTAPVFLLLVLVSSCVSKGKFLASEARVHKLQNDSTTTHNLLGDCNAQVKKMQNDYSTLQEEYASMQKDMQNLNSKSSMTIADQAKRLKSLQDLIQKQKDLMNKLRQSIADALVNFKPDELTVSIKDGKVYVSLQEKLLFKSGSAVVDPKGKQALGTLAQVLNVTPDVTVMIEGHTDTVPIHNEKFQDNWALSVGRATSIVRILTKDYDLDPHRISASGRGEFHPVESNENADGRTQNRRTEIILSPNLAELYALLGQ
jgi:chemotaxis protein MotB